MAPQSCVAGPEAAEAVPEILRKPETMRHEGEEVKDEMGDDTVKDEAEPMEEDEPEEEERRVDHTDGNAYMRAEFVEFYDGTEEWDAAFGEGVVALARQALRAHHAWSQLDKEKRVLRPIVKASAEKGVREAMAAPLARAAASIGRPLQLANPVGRPTPEEE